MQLPCHVNTVIQTRNELKKATNTRYRMPVESDAHDCTIMVFPSTASADDPVHLTSLQSEVACIANAISCYEPVHLYTRDEHVEEAKSLAGPQVIVKTADVDQLWVRDSGPIFVLDRLSQETTAVNFRFNYWGGKLESTGDEHVSHGIADSEEAPCVKSAVRLEGGAVEHDGEGTFLATESSIINDNRNPDMTKAEIEAGIRSMLGVTHFIWLPGIRGYDITDYHIDALARFIRPGVVLLSKPPATAAAVTLNAYREARAVLTQARDARGRSIQVVDCDEPDIKLIGGHAAENETIATYANYYLINGAVVMPKFGQKVTDDKAFRLFKKWFPTRDVVQVNLNSLPRTGGGIHCATQQIPRNIMASTRVRAALV